MGFMRRVGGQVDAIVEYWIGYSVEPAARVLASSAWAPDERRAYCGRCGGSIGPGEGEGPRESPVDGRGAPEDERGDRRRRPACASCPARPIADGIVRLGPYSGDLREWILAVKYGRRWVEMAELLGRRLGRAVLDARDLAIDPERVVVVPMPMPWRRRIARGIDHARVLAWAAAREMRAPAHMVLARSNAPPQSSRSARARRRAGGLGLRVARSWRRGRRAGLAREPLQGCHVVLVDDVATTGTSLRAAAGRLRTLGPARIVGAVVAVADRRSRRDRGAVRLGRIAPAAS
jgi:predicted amidophosphoribosyltransferase